MLQVRALLTYGGRLLLCLLLLELLTHTIYANAFSRFHLWTRPPQEASTEVYTGVGMASMAFYKLIFLWLKFLVIWRIARLAALLDGINPPENMLRCRIAAARRALVTANSRAQG
jgi:protein-cysteine N-palmitoyltransferase HHAT